MDVTRRHIDEISVMRNECSVSFHLGLQRTANNHHRFAGGMPMKRSDATWRKFGEDNGWSFARVAAFDGYGETFRRVRNRAEFGGGSCGNGWFFVRCLSGQTNSADSDNCSEGEQQHRKTFGGH